MKWKSCQIKMLLVLWFLGFLAVEGERLWRKYNKGKESREVEISVERKEGRVWVINNEVFSWIRFNFENYPVVAEWRGRGDDKKR